LTRDEITRTEL